jgi:hypothetical protein
MAVLSNSSKYVCGECRNKIPCDDLEGLFRDQLSRLVFDRPDLFGEPFSEDESIADAESMLADHRDTLRKTKREMERLEKLFAASKLSLDRFGETHAPLEAQRENLQEEIRRLESLLRRKKATSPSRDDAEPEDALDFRSFVKQWHTVPLEDRRAIVQSLIDHVTIGVDQIEFAYLFPNKSEDSSKDATVPQQTNDPTNEPVPAPNEPYYIRLPAPGKRCPLTGLSRSKLNELILPNERNNYKPPVKSISPKLPGRSRGTRLIVWPSLKRYLAEQDQET